MAFAAAAVATVVSACGHGTAHGVRTNGCTASTSGRDGTRVVITYHVTDSNPAAVNAVAAAVAAWNNTASNVLLRRADSGATITFASSTLPTHTAGCSGLSPRTVTVYLNDRRFATDAGKLSLVTLVSRQIGHALGLSDGGDCTGLMTLSACAATHTSPGPAEVAKINQLYPLS